MKLFFVQTNKSAKQINKPSIQSTWTNIRPF